MRKFKSYFDVPRTEVFKRYSEAEGFDANWNPLPPSETLLEDITGDLQIYRVRPLGQVVAPEGYTLEGAYRFSTLFELKTMDDVTATQADTMEKNGRIYYVWRKLAGGTGGPLSLDAYNDYILVLQGLPNEGTPV